MRKACLVVFVMTILTGTAGAQTKTCPSPSPTCTTKGTAIISGSYSCTHVGLDGSGFPQVGLLVVTLTSTGDGIGTISGFEAQNTNNPNSSPPFKDFAAFSSNYCINSDNTTGYLSPGSTNAQSCPSAIAFSSVDGVANAQFRTLESTENRIQATVCRVQ